MAAVKPRLPGHLGVIPDGNRRWANARRRPKEDGYARGVAPGLALFEACRRRGIGEISVYGYTKENLKRPASQVRAFQYAVVTLAVQLAAAGAALRVVGDRDSPAMPESLRRLHGTRGPGPRVNLLANYGWKWDVEGLGRGGLRSRDVPPVDLIVRWGGGRRLSGFLPLQSAYADFFVVDALWPDYDERHLDAALDWYRRQDRTFGG